MRCPVCGVPSPEDIRFCQRCGYRFPGLDVAPPPSGAKSDNLVVVVVLVVVAVVVIGVFALLFLKDWEFERAYYVEGAYVEVTSARWENLDSYGLPPDDGCQWLWLDYILMNEGSDDITVSGLDFMVRCSNGSEFLTIEHWGPDVLGAGGGLGTYEAVFEIPTSATPTDLVFRELFEVVCTAPIPTPEPAGPDVVISDLTVVSLPFDMDGMIWTILDEKCIWINFTMENLWWEELDLYDFTFTLEDETGELEYVWQKTGPDALDPDEEGGITLVFVVPLDFEPRELHYKMFLGPSTSVLLA